MPSIKEKLEKSKCIALGLQDLRLFLAISLFLATIVFLGALRLNIIFKSRTNVVRVADSVFDANLSGKMGAFVGSKSGKSYYFPWCGMVNRIKDANLVWFQNRAAAEALGYRAATNCNGLK